MVLCLGKNYVNFDSETLNAHALGRKRLLENLPSKPKVALLYMAKFKRNQTDTAKAQYLKTALILEEKTQLW